MSLFYRSRKADISLHRPRWTASNTERNTAESLKAALHNPHPMQHPTRSPSGSAALCALGLAAMAGAFFYASRNPRLPNGIRPVSHFNLDRFMGTWYEVARIDNNFEKSLQRTQAEYHRLSHGCIGVTNRGYDPVRNEWRVAHGKARPTMTTDIAALKVSFFGPFYSGYNVVTLDDGYRWAMVIGSTLDDFWILSRNPSLPKGIEEQLTQQAQQLGIDIQKILWVHQDGVNPTGSYK